MYYIVLSSKSWCKPPRGRRDVETCSSDISICIYHRGVCCVTNEQCTLFNKNSRNKWSQNKTDITCCEGWGIGRPNGGEVLIVRILGKRGVFRSCYYRVKRQSGFSKGRCIVGCLIERISWVSQNLPFDSTYGYETV